MSTTEEKINQLKKEFGYDKMDNTEFLSLLYNYLIEISDNKNKKNIEDIINNYSSP